MVAGMYFNESRSLTSSRDIDVPDAGFEHIGVMLPASREMAPRAHGNSTNVQNHRQSQLLAANMRYASAGPDMFGTPVGLCDSGVLPRDCWAAIALPLKRSDIGVAYRISFVAKDWEADGVKGAELIVQGDGVDLLRVVPPSDRGFQRFSTVFQPSRTPPKKQHNQNAEDNEPASTEPILRFSVRDGTVVMDDIKVVREGLDVFENFWLSSGPLTLYIVWGFLDAFIQNYVRPQQFQG